MNEREFTNPHDKIFIDCTDMPAAQLAVLLVGNGAYGIDDDDGLPIFIMGGSDEWVQEKYKMSIGEWAGSISHERVKKALLSMRLYGERSSLSDLVSRAHKMAEAADTPALAICRAALLATMGAE